MTFQHERSKTSPLTQQLIENIPQQLRNAISRKGNQLSIINADNKMVAHTSLIPENVLGGGATSIVLIGADSSMNLVSLKSFYPSAVGDKERFTKLYEDEVTVSEGIDHPNISKYFGTGLVRITEATSLPVIVREFIKRDLSDVLRENTVEIDDLISRMNSLAGGLMYLKKKKNVFVTDLKPENIGVRDDGSWAILDLGHVAIPGGKGEVGTDDFYTAPELIPKPGEAISLEERNNRASFQSEVYSLSFLAWQSLSRDKVTKEDIAFRSIYDLIEATDGISEPVKKVLQKGCSINSEDRFETPTAFAEELKNAMAEKTPEAA